jgi:formylglycine-generating enzyme required for sulfatase activity
LDKEITMKMLIKTMFALAMLALLVFGYGSLLTPASEARRPESEEDARLKLEQGQVAETVPQMRRRIVSEYIAKYQVDVGCDAACVATRQAQSPWLLPLAEQVAPFDWARATPAQQQQWTDDVARASIGHSIDWGFAFESTKHANTDCAMRSTAELNRCAPTLADWTYAAPSIWADFGRRLAASPPLLRQDLPLEDGGYQFTHQYGGPG